jgi:hypothetical protein
MFFAAAHFQSALRVERAMEEQTAPGTHGLVLHWAARYDLLAWLLTHGRERELREAIKVLPSCRQATTFWTSAAGRVLWRLPRRATSARRVR